ncbi:MAG: succinyl-diaminopimelate desuccinylase [Alphaproteobacteria bacterium]|nr:MAG: succinyl-diaminopimelate desuccinylase [Alphaproteobacteria bacterium]
MTDRAAPIAATAALRIDPVALTQALVRCPSVTPHDAGALDLIEAPLQAMGFRTWRRKIAAPGTEAVHNLFARLGEGAPHFCFAGHSDVVPVGHPEAWQVDPFAGEIVDGAVVGRGAADMKGAIAAFIAAVAGYVEERGADFSGSISLLITGDEEGPAINGTAAMLPWMADKGHIPDHCLVGEPTNPSRLGEMVKIGRRGSLNARLVVEGHQGHVAYPHLAENPIPRLMRLLDALLAEPLDAGSAHFQPSHLEITNLKVDNHATNVIPGRAEAWFNIRYNDLHSADSLETWLHDRLGTTGLDYELDIVVMGEAFRTPPGTLTEAVVGAIEERLGRRPELSTTGGTSDARFIRAYCPVVEFGLVGATMHKANEAAAIDDILALRDIYLGVLRRILAPAD